MNIHKTLITCFSIIVLLTVFIFLTQAPPTGQQSSIEVVRVGILPDEKKDVLKLRFSSLLDYLSDETGLVFHLVVPDSYEHLLRLFADREVDLAYFGGLTFVRALTHYDASPLVMRDVDTRFTSYFIVKNDGPLRNCTNLACSELGGQVFSFGPKLSTSGHLMPRNFLLTKWGIKPETIFNNVLYSSSHDQTAYNVRDDKVDIGVLNSEIFRSMRSDGRLKLGDLRIIWVTPPYSNYVWAVNKNLDDRLQTKFRDAFLKLDITNTSDDKILSSVGATGFLPAGISEFMPLMDIAKSLDLLSKATP